jgi:hypothetical protein
MVLVNLDDDQASCLMHQHPLGNGLEIAGEVVPRRSPSASRRLGQERSRAKALCRATRDPSDGIQCSI